MAKPKPGGMGKRVVHGSGESASTVRSTIPDNPTWAHLMGPDPVRAPSSNAAPSLAHVVDDASSVKSSVHQPPSAFRQQTIKTKSSDLTSENSELGKADEEGFHNRLFGQVVNQQ